MGTLFSVAISSTRLRSGFHALLVFLPGLGLALAPIERLMGPFEGLAFELLVEHGWTMVLRHAVWTRTFWGITLALLVGGLILLVGYTPVETSMGPAQKIFYLHLPAAFSTFLAGSVVFVASIGFLGSRRRVWDDLAHAGAVVTVLFSSVVLLTGMLWARSAWGTWWTWSPRLTFSLVLWLLYVVYLVLRPSIEPPQRGAVISAVYGIVAFLDVPLVYLTVKLLPDIHPSSMELAPGMRHTLFYWFAPVTMLCVGLIAARFHLARRSAALDPERVPPPNPSAAESHA